VGVSLSEALARGRGGWWRAARRPTIGGDPIPDLTEAAVRPLALALAALLAPSMLDAQPARVIAPAENLVAEGIPPVPAALVEEVRRYTEARAASLAAWHPTRREILVSTRFGNVPQLHHVARPGGARRQLTFFDEPIGSATFEPREGRSFLFLKDVGGNEFTQVYRYDLEGGAVTLLTDGGRSQNSLPLWSPDGGLVAFGSTMRNGADRDVWVMDPADPESRRMVMENAGGGWWVLDWSPDGSTLLVMEYESVSRSHLWTVDVASGRRTRVTPETADTVSYGAAVFADGGSLFVTTDRGREFRTLARLDLASGALAPLTADIPWDVEGIELAHDRRTLAFTTNEAGISRLYLMDVASGERRRMDAVPVGLVGGLAWHRSGTELGFSLNSARSPTDAYSLDVRTGEVTRWTESEMGGLDPEDLSEPELVRWTSFDGLEITGFLYRPPARFTGPRPVVVNIHGGPESQARPGFQGRTNYLLNELGVAVIYPNVRGSTGFGKTFVRLDNGLLRENSVRDVGALLDWLATRPELDEDRVMVTGGSYGGYMTFATATHYPERIRSALAVVGISHFGTFLRNTESYRRDLRRAEYGDERDPEIAAFFERISPLNNADRIAKPLFVVQGGNDPRVPLSEAEQIVERVREVGTPVWYLMARDEGHGFRKKGNVDFQFYATVLFLRETLLR
jgi:dipeptidyl aminopeptidase/acylaminoacyl peptidase